MRDWYANWEWGGQQLLLSEKRPTPSAMHCRFSPLIQDYMQVLRAIQIHVTCLETVETDLLDPLILKSFHQNLRFAYQPPVSYRTLLFIVPSPFHAFLFVTNCCDRNTCYVQRDGHTSFARLIAHNPFGAGWLWLRSPTRKQASCWGL
jgi:hypothetical protein